MSEPTWYIVKENIQPITQGRKIDVLQEALQSFSLKDPKQRADELEKKANKFHSCLEQNKDNLHERLTIWHKYIDWIEQNYPQGDNGSKLSEAIENCIEEFYEKVEFKQDKRLFDVFMKFKRFCGDPLEIFNFMRANAICTLIAQFYTSWAWQYDMRNNVKKADEILELGINSRASPMEFLVSARDCLQFRIVKAMMSGEASEFVGSERSGAAETNAALASGGIRKALQSLKMKQCEATGVGKIGVNRVGGEAVNYHDLGGLKSQIKVINGVKTIVKAPPRANSTAVDVFSDENISIDDSETLQKIKFPAPIPNSQRATLVGKTGLENEIKHKQFIEPNGTLRPPPVVSRTIRVKPTVSRISSLSRRTTARQPPNKNAKTRFEIFEDN